MKTLVSLSYFHRKIGPLVFYSFPEKVLDGQLSVRIANIMDQAFEEGFFTHSFENFNSMNYYFEIFSEWARGNKEMLMLSVLFDQVTDSDIEQNVLNWCIEFAEKLQSNEEIYKAFYINEKNSFELDEQNKIESNEDLIRIWLRELYWASLEEIREKTEEERIASLLRDQEIFYTLEKLSNGPITYEDLQRWFAEKFKLSLFEQIIKTLLDEQFIFINEIGHERYVLLVKEVEAIRMPPKSVIEYFDEIPELIDVVIQKVTQFFDLYAANEEDSFKLFQLISDPKIYNVLSKLRGGRPMLKDSLPKVVSERTLTSLLDVLNTLKNHEVIDDFKFEGETYVILKTNVQITTSFPKYLRKLLPKESKAVVAHEYEPKLSIEEQSREKVAEIFQDVRKKERSPTEKKNIEIQSFLEDLSSKPTKKKEKE